MAFVLESHLRRFMADPSPVDQLQSTHFQWPSVLIGSSIFATISSSNLLVAFSLNGSVAYWTLNPVGGLGGVVSEEEMQPIRFAETHCK